MVTLSHTFLWALLALFQGDFVCVVKLWLVYFGDDVISHSISIFRVRLFIAGCIIACGYLNERGRTREEDRSFLLDIIYNFIFCIVVVWQLRLYRGSHWLLWICRYWSNYFWTVSCYSLLRLRHSTKAVDYVLFILT